MTNEKLQRINALAKKEREEGLSGEEKAEQTILRQEYVKGVRNDLTSTLKNITIVDEKGNKQSKIKPVAKVGQVQHSPKVTRTAGKRKREQPS